MELPQSIVVIGAGTLTLTSAIISFVNARLADAKTPEHKERVWRVLRLVAEMLLFLSAFVALQFEAYKVATVLAVACHLYHWCKLSFKDGPLERSDVSSAINTGFLAVFIILVWVGASHDSLRKAANEEIEKLQKRVDGLEKKGGQDID